ncbi:MAG: hypothetical protein AAGE59_31735 [Cyanobacteria bacterium P01_F01_bin.86]
MPSQFFICEGILVAYQERGFHRVSLSAVNSLQSMAEIAFPPATKLKNFYRVMQSFGHIASRLTVRLRVGSHGLINKLFACTPITIQGFAVNHGTIATSANKFLAPKKEQEP